MKRGLRIDFALKRAKTPEVVGQFRLAEFAAHQKNAGKPFASRTSFSDQRQHRVEVMFKKVLQKAGSDGGADVFARICSPFSGESPNLHGT